MVRSCTMASNCVKLQIIFCSCVNETTLFSFLRSFLREKRQIASFPEDIHYTQTCWSNDKTVFKLGYRKISWFVSVPQISNIACLSLRLWQIIDLLTTDKSRYFAQPRPIIVNYLPSPPPEKKIAYPLFFISPGYYSCPKRNWKQCLCKRLGWGQMRCIMEDVQVAYANFLRGWYSSPTSDNPHQQV